MTCYTPNIPHEKEPSPRWQWLADRLRHVAGLQHDFEAEDCL